MPLLLHKMELISRVNMFVWTHFVCMAIILVLHKMRDMFARRWKNRELRFRPFKIYGRLAIGCRRVVHKSLFTSSSQGRKFCFAQSLSISLLLAQPEFLVRELAAL